MEVGSHPMATGWYSFELDHCMKKHSFIYRNSLSIVLILCFLICIGGQIYTGMQEHNQELIEHGASPVPLSAYLTTGHFVQTTFENWESEFLQMAMYVILTIFLRQQGSSESKPLDDEEEVDREPDASRKDAPWPVRRGGIALAVYKHSLSLAFALLFILSFVLHAHGSLANFNEEQMLQGKPEVSMSQFMGKTRFWFESFQNWQSEFVAVIAIVVLSIFLRQYRSPESKPVDAPDSETGGG
jgi:hypothetical protein